MAFTKVVGAGIHTLSNITSHNINSSGIITATKFVGPMENGSGISTFYDLRVTNNLTVDGTTTTLDTKLVEVDKIEVEADSTNVAIAVTHTGSGDILRLYDGTSQVVTVDDEGQVGIGTATPAQKLDVVGNMKISGNIDANGDLDVDGLTNLDNTIIAGITTFTNVVTKFGAANGGNTHLQILSSGSGEAGIFFDAANGDISGSDYIFIGQQNNLDFIIKANPNAGNIDFQRGEAKLVRIDTNGKVGINTTSPQNSASVQHYTSTTRHQSFQSSDGDLAIVSNNNSNPVVYVKGTGSADLVNVFDNTTEVFTIKDGGNVGIGTQNPETILTIAKNATNQTVATIPTVRLTNLDTTAVATDIVGSYEFFSKDAHSENKVTGFMRNTPTDAGVNYDLTFGTIKTGDSNAVEKLRITSDGNVGIGTDDPSAPLNVHKISGTIAVFGDDRTGDNSTFECIKIKNNVATYPAITCDSSNDTLDLRSMGNVQVTIDSNNNSTGKYFRVMTNGEGASGTELFRVGDDGKLFLNHTSNSNATVVIKGLTDNTHPVIKVRGTQVNGYTLLGDEYVTDESQFTMGCAYSAASFVLGWGVKVNTSANNAYISSQDTYATKRGAIKFDGSGLRFLTHDSSQTITTDSAVTLTERLLINSSGRLLLGGTAVSQTNRNLVVGSNAEANLAIETHNDAASESANIRFYKSRGTAASPTAVADDHIISQFLFYGHDGNDYAHPVGVIRAKVNGSPTTNQMPGELSFHTNHGTTYATERLKIQANGRITMGEADFDASNDLHLKKANAAGDVAMRITNNTSDNASTASLYFTTSPTQNFNTSYIQAKRDGGKLDFGYATNSPTVTMKVSTGVVGINATNPQSKLEVLESSTTQSETDKRIAIFRKNGTALGDEGYIHLTTMTGHYGVKLGYRNEGASPGYLNQGFFISTVNSGETIDNHTKKFVIKSNGNVGIAETNPSYKLQVNGSVYVDNNSLTVEKHTMRGTGDWAGASHQLHHKRSFTNNTWTNYFKFYRTTTTANNNDVGTYAGLLHIVYINDRSNTVHTTGYDVYPFIVRARSSTDVEGYMNNGSPLIDYQQVIGSSVEVRFTNASANQIDLQIKIYNSDGGGSEQLCHAWIDGGGASNNSSRFLYPSVLT